MVDFIIAFTSVYLYLLVMTGGAIGFMVRAIRRLIRRQYVRFALYAFIAISLIRFGILQFIF